MNPAGFPSFRSDFLGQRITLTLLKFVQPIAMSVKEL